MSVLSNPAASNSGLAGPLLKADGDRAFVDHDRRCGVDEIAEQMARFDRLVPVTDLLAKVAVQTAGRMSVSWTSQLTFNATADDNASM